MTSFSFGCKENDDEGDEMLLRSYEGRQGPCGQVASGGSRCTGSGCSLLGSVLYGSRKDKMILQM